MQQHAAMTARPWRLHLYGINSWLFPLKKKDASFILVKLHVLSWFQSVSDFSYFNLFQVIFNFVFSIIHPKHWNSSVDAYCWLVERGISHLFNHKRQLKIKHSLTKAQQTALNIWQKANFIIMTNADKLCWDREGSKQDVLRKMNNITFLKINDYKETLL